MAGKSTRTITKRTYNPTSQELTDKIQAVLESKPNADSKEIHEILLQKNDLQLWKIPERRVAKFVKKAKSTQDEGDDSSVTSTGTMGSFRRYMQERKSRREARKDERRSQNNKSGNVLDINTDDIGSVSTLGSSSPSLRKLFGRDRSASKSINHISNSNVVGDDDDDRSVSSVRRFFKDRKLRQQSKKNVKNNSKNGTPPVVTVSVGPAAPPETIQTQNSVQETESLLSPLEDNEKEPDLMVVVEKDTHLGDKSSKPTDKRTSNEPQSTLGAMPEVDSLYTDDDGEKGASKNCCGGCSLWSPWSKGTTAKLVE